MSNSSSMAYQEVERLIWRVVLSRSNGYLLFCSSTLKEAQRQFDSYTQELESSESKTNTTLQGF